MQNIFCVFLFCDVNSKNKENVVSFTFHFTLTNQVKSIVKKKLFSANFLSDEIS